MALLERLLAVPPPLPLHLPAHGRGRALAPGLRRLLRQPPGRWDLPELPEIGGPLEADGAVAEAQAAAANLLGAQRCWFGVNGASGLLQVGSQVFRHEFQPREAADAALETDRDLVKASPYVAALLPPPL